MEASDDQSNDARQAVLPPVGLSKDKADLLEVLEELLPLFCDVDEELYFAADDAVRDLKRQASGEAPQSRPFKGMDSDG